MNRSFISGTVLSNIESVSMADTREGIFELIKKEYPEITRQSWISLDEHNHYRRLYLSALILQENGDLASIDKDVINAIAHNSILSENIEILFDEETTLGERLADKIAIFGGSWAFIIVFFSFILMWMLINVLMLTSHPFDSFPFILLNLILSCLASIQAPVILMSQNRQQQKDRSRSEQDYKVNLKAELEIKLLGEKLDYLLIHHNKKLLDIQQLQVDYLNDLMQKISAKV